MSLSTAKALASASQVYTWEPPDRVIAERYGLAPESILRFDLNTSPTAPDLLSEALPGPFDPPLNEYPDSTYAELAEAAAEYVGAEPEEILVGCGADEVLDIIAKTFLAPGRTALVPLPTYSMYGVLTNQRGARMQAVLRLGPDAGFALDLPAMLEAIADVAVVWLCAPNNPTGAPEARTTIETLLVAAAALHGGGPAIVVDEAYIEFDPGSLVELRERFPRLIVVRTVSKAFALPGLRVGYAVAARPTIERLERLRAPGSISTVSATIAAAALRQPDYARDNAATISAERDRLAGRLDELGLPAYPSVTNFLLVRIGSQDDADDAAEHLLGNGIVPRTFGLANPLRGHLRFTVRTRDQNERFLEVIGAWIDGRSA
ncbi:MAG: histidinol-phosphate transaminase [Chloroflexota bacterium]